MKWWVTTSALSRNARCSVMQQPACPETLVLARGKSMLRNKLSLQREELLPALLSVDEHAARGHSPWLPRLLRDA